MLSKERGVYKTDILCTYFAPTATAAEDRMNRNRVFYTCGFVIDVCPSPPLPQYNYISAAAAQSSDHTFD